MSCKFAHKKTSTIVDLVEVDLEKSIVTYLSNGFVRSLPFEDFFDHYKPHVDSKYAAFWPDERQSERKIDRRLNHEYYDGIRVIAYMEDRITQYGTFPSYSGHWSTLGENAVNPQRLFAEGDVLPVIDELKHQVKFLTEKLEKLEKE